jgi:Rhodopirellula transposase DDE domain
LFRFITKNWRGRPLECHHTIGELINSTTIENGLLVRAALDQAEYKAGIKVSDEEFAQVLLKRNDFHANWNDTIRHRRI